LVARHTNAEAESECPVDLFALPSDDEWFNSMADLLDSTISQAATEAGITFVDPRPAVQRLS